MLLNRILLATTKRTFSTCGHLNTSMITLSSHKAIIQKTPKIHQSIIYEDTNSFSTASTTDSNGSSFLSKITGGSSSSEKTPSPPSDQYAKQMYEMSKIESWTLSTFSDQVKSMSGGWKSKLPFLSNTEQVKQMKRMQALIDATVDVLGGDVKVDALKEIGKKEKLMICLKCDADLQDVNGLIAQFESTDMMHRLLRYRLNNGKPIPASEAESKTMMQEDLKKVLTPKEFRDMRQRKMKSMMNNN